MLSQFHESFEIALSRINASSLFLLQVVCSTDKTSLRYGHTNSQNPSVLIDYYIPNHRLLLSVKSLNFAYHFFHDCTLKFLRRIKNSKIIIIISWNLIHNSNINQISYPLNCFFCCMDTHLIM